MTITEDCKMSQAQSQIKSFMVTCDSSQMTPKRRGTSRKKKGEESEAPVVRKHGGTYEGSPVGIPGVATAGVLPLAVKSVVSGYTAPTMPGNGAMSLQGAPLKELQEIGQMGGADRHIKVELKKSTTPRKVHLNPKKSEKDKKHDSNKTRKARKVTLGMSSLRNRVTRAKKIHTKVKEMPIEDLRKELIKRGLIKETSKAPESILRQIAADAQIVGGKGL
jgi:hypothetical protein